jgi:hypothetical protein
MDDLNTILASRSEQLLDIRHDTPIRLVVEVMVGGPIRVRRIKTRLKPDALHINDK